MFLFLLTIQPCVILYFNLISLLIELLHNSGNDIFILRDDPFEFLALSIHSIHYVCVPLLSKF